MDSPFSYLSRMLTSNISNLISMTSPLTSLSSIESRPREVLRKYENSDRYFLEFSCKGNKVGKIIVKVYEDVGPIGEAFKEYATMENGFGYKGSRVYAVCPGEWCLMGDILFKEKHKENISPFDWNRNESDTEEENQSYDKPPQIHKGIFGVPAWETSYADDPGSVVAVGSRIHYEGKSDYKWDFGPQFKVIFLQPSIRSGAVFGQVLSGISSLKRISERGTVNMEPSERITISDCGLIEG